MLKSKLVLYGKFGTGKKKIWRQAWSPQTKNLVARFAVIIAVALTVLENIVVGRRLLRIVAQCFEESH